MCFGRRGGGGARNTCPSPPAVLILHPLGGRGMHPAREGRCVWRGARAPGPVSVQGCWGPPSTGAFSESPRPREAAPQRKPRAQTGRGGWCERLGPLPERWGWNTMSRARAGGRAGASENSLTQQLGKWVCSPAPQINRSCSLRSAAAGSAQGGRARRSGTSTRSGTRTPCPCRKPSSDPPGRSTAGSTHLGREYPHRVHTCGGSRRCWLQAPWSHQAPPTLDRLWRSQEWLVTVRCRESSLLWGSGGQGGKGRAS